MSEKKSLFIGIVWYYFNVKLYSINFKQENMISRLVISEFKWITIAFIVSLILVAFLDSYVAFPNESINSHNTFFGLSKFLEILVFFTFCTFVVYGVKGFFEMYSQKIANLIMIITGSLLTLAVIFLSYQVLFKS